LRARAAGGSFEASLGGDDVTPNKLVRALRSPPSDAATSSARRGSALPPDLLREASWRLGAIALVFTAMTTVLFTLTHTVFPRLGFAWPLAMNVVVVGIGLASFGVFVFTRFSRSEPAFFLTLGAVYEVCVAAALAVGNHVTASRDLMMAGPFISRVLLVIVLFPAFVPSAPRRTLVTALLAASMDPLAMVVAIAARHLDVPLGHLLWMHLPNYLGAGIATVISGIITGLGREVRDARDLGSYRLGELLGRGGMGEVYHATHRLLARPAAIKLIPPEALDRSPDRAHAAIERFKREARAAATLRSPHTIELYDFGVSEEGVFYYVMELLEGLDLEALVERFGPLPPERAIHLLTQALESLGEAHERGLMHRDIKPSNIHTCRLGPSVDFVKLLDFGLVKAQPGAGSDAPHLTVPGGTPGTPAFMAPEAILDGSSADHRGDLYALGCVGYWLVTGTLVFDADSSARMMMHLAKQPEDRPRNAKELSRRLAACPVLEPWTEERAQAWWDEHLPIGADLRPPTRSDVHVDFPAPPVA
jgi:serine/threonine-protein kinase